LLDEPDGPDRVGWGAGGTGNHGSGMGGNGHRDRKSPLPALPSHTAVCRRRGGTRRCHRQPGRCGRWRAQPGGPGRCPPALHRGLPCIDRGYSEPFAARLRVVAWMR
jgi:hypothetical protein